MPDLFINDISTIFEQLKPLSLFELNRLRSAITKILNDPTKNELIKQQLKVGMRITYFCSDRNKLIEATIEQIRKTWASVIDVCDGKKWNIKFYLINLEKIDVNLNSRQSSGGLDRNLLKIGDRVGWVSKLGYELYGVVEKLNPKKALVRLGDGERWTVPYSLLFFVMDGVPTHSRHLCIEGEVVS